MATPWWKYERGSKAYEACAGAGMAFVFAALFGLQALSGSVQYGQGYMAVGWLTVGVFHSWRAWRATRKNAGTLSPSASVDSPDLRE